MGIAASVTDRVPLAELHVHLEGTIAPATARELARRNGRELPARLFDGEAAYRWRDFGEFLATYDAAAYAIGSAEDYAEVTRDYLTSLAADGAIYAELTLSPQHAALAGVGWDEHLAGVAAGAADARRETGIESRGIVTALRHEPPGRALELARRLAGEPHPFITGFGLAGDEKAAPAADFAPAFEVAAGAGLGCTVHAGEVLGPESIRAALELPIARIGHGVRAIEDVSVVAALAERGVVLEVCPSSNLALGVYPTPEDHPLRRLFQAGVRVTLGSDDPPHFNTTLAREYDLAERRLGFDREELRRITRTAIEAAFVDERTRSALLDRVDTPASPRA
jgi:adenosine deaminase